MQSDVPYCAAKGFLERLETETDPISVTTATLKALQDLYRDRSEADRRWLARCFYRAADRLAAPED